MTHYDKAWAAHLKRNNILTPNEQTFRHGWNAALAAAESLALESGEDAREAAKAKDATDYVAGYQDAGVDVQEAIREIGVEVFT